MNPQKEALAAHPGGVNQPTSVPDRLTELRELHTRSYRSGGDEAWKRDPICQECGHAWPCPVAEVFELVAAEVAHQVNPVIGWLRRIEADTPNKALTVSVERLRGVVDTFRGW